MNDDTCYTSGASFVIDLGYDGLTRLGRGPTDMICRNPLLGYGIFRLLIGLY